MSPAAWASRMKPSHATASAGRCCIDADMLQHRQRRSWPGCGCRAERRAERCEGRAAWAGEAVHGEVKRLLGHEWLSGSGVGGEDAGVPTAASPGRQ
jgi:hypothetical protein